METREPQSDNVPELSPADGSLKDNAADTQGPTAPPAPEVGPEMRAPPPATELAPIAIPAPTTHRIASQEAQQPAAEASASIDEPPSMSTIPMPSDEAVVARLRHILGEVDLSVTTEKMIRRRLETEYGMDLSSKKPVIRREIETYLNAQAAGDGGVEGDGGDEEDREEVGGSGRSRKRRHRFGDILSQPMAAFLQMERCPRTQVVKKLWEYIKANNLQDPKDRRRVLLDDKMKTIFPGKSVNMFSMQKLLSKHVFVAESSEEESPDGEQEQDDEDDNEPPKRRKTAASKPTPSKKARKSSDGASPRVNGFTKPVKLSPQLAAFMGSETAPRPQITKKLWEYVKERGLQDPSNKQFILADETLRELTGENRFQAFSFSKLIKEHILGYA